MTGVQTCALPISSAEAKRLGGGKSFGKQSSNVTQREAAPGGANSNDKTSQSGGDPFRIEDANENKTDCKENSE